jgi:hypothetical protein
MMFLLYTTIKYKGSLQYWNKKYFQRWTLSAIHWGVYDINSANLRHNYLHVNYLELLGFAKSAETWIYSIYIYITLNKYDIYANFRQVMHIY